MATIKGYTDIEQSRKLAKILPLESADMWWSRCTITDFGDGVLKVSYAVEPCNISQFRNTKEDIPCWSLAVLLDVLPSGYSAILTKSFDGKDYYCKIDGKPFETKAKNPIDACYNLILKLNELKML